MINFSTKSGAARAAPAAPLLTALISVYSNVLSIFKCFMTNKPPSSTRKHRKSTKPGTQKTFFFFLSFLLSSSDKLARGCVTLSRWFTHHLIQSSAQPHHFLTTLKSHQALATTHSKTMASSLGHHFLHLYTCMCT